MATLTIGRLALGKPPAPFTESLGDPLATVGGAVVPGSRVAPSFTVALATYLDGSQLGSVGLASGQLLRRALRSMMNNTSLKLQGFLYVVYSDDLEQNGWYAPDATQLTSQDNQAGFGAGLWQTSGNWYVLGRYRTHREGRQIWMKDLRGAQYPRDYLGLIQSTDFSALPLLQLSILPNGATQVMNNVSGQVVAGVALPTGRDGGIGQQISGQSDLTVVSYERAEASLNLSDVIVYDRRGNRGPFQYVSNPLDSSSLVGWSTTSGGVAGGATLTADSAATNIPFGSYAGKIITTAGGASQGASTTASSTFLQGVAYTVSFHLKGNAGGENVQLYFGGTATGDTVFLNVTLTTSWQRFNLTWTPSALYVGPDVAIRTQAATAYTFWANAVQVVRGSQHASFIEGDVYDVFGLGTYQAAVRALPGLISYWRLGDTSGANSVSFDEVGGHNGTYQVSNGSVITAGAVGDGDPAVTLSNSGYVSYLNPAAFQISSGSMGIMVKTVQAADGSYHAIMEKDNAYSLFVLQTTGTLGLYDWTAGANRDSGKSINDGNWHHVVLTFRSGVANGTIIYLDGVPVLTTTMTIAGQANNLQIGNSAGTSQPLPGSFDEAWLSSSVLTATQVASLYAALQSNSTIPQNNGYGWEEVYGPDYPWNWLTAGQPNDCPVLDNGLARVRYDDVVGKPGFRVDVWNGAAYVEQGKMYCHRAGDTDNDDNTWVSASLVEYTPDRAVMLCVLRASGDAISRERIFITMERGVIGCTFEGYPALKAAGTQADIHWQWGPALNAGAADLNASVAKADTQTSSPGAAGTVAYAATAGTGAGTGNSGQFGGGATLGAASFAASENWVALLRCPATFNVIGAYQTTLAVLQAVNMALVYQGGDTAAYGVSDNVIIADGQGGAGYAQVQLSFAAAQVDQIIEAESMTLGANTALATVASSSGAASNNATTATRTTDANAHVTRATWPNGFSATYRVFVRVKVSASTGHFYAKTGATTGAAVTTTSTSYVWLDLGEIVANNTTLEIHAWLTAAATVTVDRVEAVLVQDRVRGSAIFSGSRDAGQAALQDSRITGRLVAR